MDKTKEIVYDEQISPLMGQIVDICKKHSISCVSSFALAQENEDGKQLMCTTMILNKESNPPDSFMEIRDILQPRIRKTLYVTTQRSDETEIIAII